MEGQGLGKELLNWRSINIVVLRVRYDVKHEELQVYHMIWVKIEEVYNSGLHLWPPGIWINVFLAPFFTPLFFSGLEGWGVDRFILP